MTVPDDVGFGEIEAALIRDGRPEPGRRKDPMKLCLARTRRGTPCQAPAMRNAYSGRRLRCRWHGGSSTGPRTPEGRAKAAAAVTRHGRYTSAAIAQRRQARQRLAELKQIKEIIA
jgi:hypothetical protein